MRAILERIAQAGWFVATWVFIGYFGAAPIIRWIAEPPNYEAECIKATMEYVGLRACDADGRCNLGRYQVYRKSESLKNSIEQCARYEFAEKLREAQTAMDGQTPSGEEDGNSSGYPQSTDSDQLETRRDRRQSGLEGSDELHMAAAPDVATASPGSNRDRIVLTGPRHKNPAPLQGN